MTDVDGLNFLRVSCTLRRWTIPADLPDNLRQLLASALHEVDSAIEEVASTFLRSTVTAVGTGARLAEVSSFYLGDFREAMQGAEDRMNVAVRHVASSWHETISAAERALPGLAATLPRPDELVGMFSIEVKCDQNEVRDLRVGALVPRVPV